MRFYVPGMPTASFTYDIETVDGSDTFQFSLRDFNVDPSTIPINIYPTLQHITYDFVHMTLNGTCTVPTSGNDTSTSPCMVGTFEVNSLLALNLTSSVPLNNTLNASDTTSVTTQLRSVNSGWTWGDGYPAFILDTVEGTDGAANAEVLRTSVVKPSDCTQFKVCVRGIQGRAGGAVGAEVLAPLGIALIQESQAAIQCTTHDDDDD